MFSLFSFPFFLMQLTISPTLQTSSTTNAKSRVTDGYLLTSVNLTLLALLLNKTSKLISKATVS